MAFSQAFIEEVKNRNGIEEIISRYLTLKRAVIYKTVSRLLC